MPLRRCTIATVVCMSALVLASLVGCASQNTPLGGSGSVSPNGNNGMMNRGGSSGSASSGVDQNNNGGGTSSVGQGGGMMGGGANNYSSAGERIYLSGVGSDGRDISRTAPRVSQGALMMGGGGCASCHAANGRGGTIRMMTGTAIKAPNVTYGSLIKNGFTDATIRKAITDGLDEAGKPLDAAMPLWQMSNADLDATIAYLKVLSTK